MKKRKIRLIKSLFKDKKKSFELKSIMPDKVFYIWEKNHLTKIETFSL